ncbi:unnamed protein product [Symbiodinium natans]|uniref:Uncharacterized protein n=1 Tax=Symbiodinium natans TaxID=878477 RepID=A0A812RUD4_9DINO|nr:unnamed protein product [Symbiodinium natans]
MAWLWWLLWLALAQGQDSIDCDELEPEALELSLLQLGQRLGRVATAGAVEPVHPQQEPKDTSCTGAFHVCTLAERHTCAYIPGCHWHRETAYGGWCTENGAKASEGSKEAKEAKGAKSAKSAKGAKGAKAKSPHCATMDGPRCAAEPACRWEKSWIDAGCRGDGSRWQNPGCSFTNDAEACMFMPGCNWRGRSSYGGWCSSKGDSNEAGKACAFETTQSACTQHGCIWTVSA